MALPRLGQYQLALQHPRTAFQDAELRSAAVEMTPMGLPRVISGGFALTYHLRNGRKEWAVRCFHREASDLARRYAAIAQMVAQAPPGPFVSAEYLSKGVHVEGAWYPVTKMPWLQAVPLNRCVETNLEKRVLARLAQQFRALVDRLDAIGVAHGDLQHGNILVDAFGTMKLVDYDGMFVPALAGLPSNESGHVNYQHPQRVGQFDALLDRFSAAVIYVALTALAADPSLWTRYSNGENLLFRRADFDDPSGSPLFADLQRGTAVAPLAERLRSLCRADYAALPTLKEFVDGRLPVASRTTQPAVTPASRTQFDVLDAADTERLLHHEGDVVTLVGRIVSTQQRWSRQKRPYVSIALGPAAKSGAALLLWSQALNFFMPAGQVITAYHGRWVRATGLVSITHRRDAARTPRPMVTINLPSDIQLVSEDEARDLLTPGGVPWYRAHRRPGPAPQRPVSARTAATLNRLYGGTVPADGDSPTSGIPKKARPRKAAGKRVARARKPKAAGGAEWWRGFLAGAGLQSPARTGGSGLAALGRGVLSQLIKVMLAATAVAMVATVLLIRALW